MYFILLHIAAYGETECLSCSAAQQHSALTVQVLYKFYNYNWTLLTVITQTSCYVHVQLHNSGETAKLMSSELECRRFFQII